MRRVITMTQYSVTIQLQWLYALTMHRVVTMDDALTMHTARGHTLCSPGFYIYHLGYLPLYLLLHSSSSKHFWDDILDIISH